MTLQQEPPHPTSGKRRESRVSSVSPLRGATPRSSSASTSKSPGRVRPQSSMKARDPVSDALDMKRRQFEAQHKLLEKRREKELEECSFSPAISYVSRELADSNPYRRAVPLHQRSTGHVSRVWEEEKAEPKVFIGEVSRALAERIPGRDVPIGERSVKEQQAFAARMKKEASEKERLEIETATHAPQTNSNSAKILSKRKGATDAMGRLTEEYVRKREEARVKATREAEDRLAQDLAKPAYVNKQSEKMLQQATSEGREIKGINRSSKPKTPRTHINGDLTQRFDNEYGGGTATPRNSIVSRQHSGVISPRSVTPRTPMSSTVSTPRISVQRAASASDKFKTIDSNCSSQVKSMSPENKATSNNKIASPRNTTLAVRTSPSRSSRDGGDLNDEDKKIFAANPNSLCESGSDLKWLARMTNKTGISEPWQHGVRTASRMSPPHTRGSDTGALNLMSEMDRMRKEFQRIVQEKEDETKMLLEQIKTQKVEASNAELFAENERLRKDLDAQMQRVSELESDLEAHRECVQEAEDERDHLRKANDKLRLDLEAITEKGQAVVELNAKLTLQLKTLKTKVAGRSKSNMKIDADDDHSKSQSPSDEDAVKAKRFQEFLNDSDESSPER